MIETLPTSKRDESDDTKKKLILFDFSMDACQQTKIDLTTGPIQYIHNHAFLMELLALGMDLRDVVEENMPASGLVEDSADEESSAEGESSTEEQKVRCVWLVWLS
jgi:hypothetical protein